MQVWIRLKDEHRIASCNDFGAYREEPQLPGFAFIMIEVSLDEWEVSQRVDAGDVHVTLPDDMVHLVRKER